VGAPALLAGYGGFQVSEVPLYSPRVLLWLEQARRLCSLPNLRGGGEYGDAWHRAGMLDKKQNVFDDFAAAEWPVGASWARPGRIAISGGRTAASS